MRLRQLGAAARVATGALLLCMAAVAVAAAPDDALHEAVGKANAEWAQAMKTGDAAVIAAPYTDAAVFVLPDGTCLHGRAEIEKLYRDGFQKGGPASSTKIESKQLVRDGDVAYESGFAEVGVMRDGKSVTRGGRYLTVWHLGTDRTWRIVRNVVLP